MTERVGVIVPTLNEAENIRDCLESLLRLEAPDDCEIRIGVFDGGSTDQTRVIVQSLADRYPQLVLITNPFGTAPYAFNMGIELLEADYIAIIGAHSAVDPSYVRHGIEMLRSDPAIAVVGGLLENSYTNLTAEAIGVAMSSRFGVGNAHFRTGSRVGDVDTVAFGIYRVSVFRVSGQFDTNLARNQDDELSFRIRKLGFRIVLHPRMHATYVVRSDFSKLAHQYFQYGYWKVFVNRKHGRVTTVRQLVPAAFLLYLSMLFADFALGGGRVRKLLVLPLIAYLVGAVAVARRGSSPSLTFRAILTLHLSYGAGYLAGVWDFLIRRRRSPAQQHYRISR